MRASVTSFQRTSEPSFPDNESLPKKGEEEKKFDKRFNEWWDDVKLNLARQNDLITKFTQDQLSESINLNKQETDQALAGLDEKTIELLNEVSNNLSVVSSNLQSVENNLYSI